MHHGCAEREIRVPNAMSYAANFNEMYTPDGAVRKHYAGVADWIAARPIAFALSSAKSRAWSSVIVATASLMRSVAISTAASIVWMHNSTHR